MGAVVAPIGGSGAKGAASCPRLQRTHFARAVHLLGVLHNGAAPFARPGPDLVFLTLTVTRPIRGLIERAPMILARQVD